MSNRKYYVDENSFDDIESEEVQYWVGFLMADGCITGNVLKLKLQHSDKKQVLKFKDFLKSEHIVKKVNEYNNHKTCSFDVYSKKLTDVLSNRYNIIPNKTKTAECPEELINSRHFWRGVIDGDGSVNFKNEKAFIGLWSGSIKLLKQFETFVKNNVKIRNKITKGHRCYCFRNHSQKAAPKIIKLLYKDSNVHLNRKKKAAIKVLKEVDIDEQ